MLQVLRFDQDVAEPILNFDAVSAAGVDLGHGSGESHVYAVHLGAGGEIGPHEAGFGQLFVVVGGSAWVAAGEQRVEAAAGQSVFIPRGTVHAKGSETGAMVIMIQMWDVDPGRPGTVG